MHGEANNIETQVKSYPLRSNAHQSTVNIELLGFSFSPSYVPHTNLRITCRRRGRLDANRWPWFVNSLFSTYDEYI